MDDIKDRRDKFWEASNRFQVPFSSAREMGFADDDAHLLADVGLPAWAAPNLHLHFPRQDGSGQILIGEDRDCLPLVYDRHNSQVFARLADGRNVLVAPSLGELLKLLIEYAQMVDSAILASGAHAWVDNNVPNDLIDAFETTVEGVLHGKESLWRKELERLRSGVGDACGYDAT